MFDFGKQKLFIKYFYNYFTPIFVVLFFISILSSVLVFEKLSKHDETFKDSVNSSVNGIFQSISDTSTRTFTGILSNPQYSEFLKNKLDEDDDYEIHNYIYPLTEHLKSIYLGSKYTSSVYLYSFLNDSLLSESSFERNISLNKRYRNFLDDICKNSNRNKYFAAITTDGYDNQKKLCFVQTIDNGSENIGVICIMMNLITLKSDINKILKNTDVSFALLDNNSEKILFSANKFNRKRFFSNQNYDNGTYRRSMYDENVECIISYENYHNLSDIKTVAMVEITIFIVLVLISAFISYLRAKVIYSPINEIINVLGAPENFEYMNIPPKMTNYAEIKYIINTIKNQKENVNDLENQIKKYKSAKKAALQAQISPHFIANTLEVINLEAYSLTKSENTVTEMVCQLADIMRITFQTGARLVKISDELLLTNQYLNIQKVRYTNLFDVVFDIEPTVNNYLTPHLILQPLAENAINHGIIPKKEHTTMTLKAYADNDNICFEIFDNGVGIPPEKLYEINSSLQSTDEPFGKSIGLKNVNLRIKIIFGNEYGITVTSNDRGTVQKVVIPKIAETQNGIQ